MMSEMGIVCPKCGTEIKLNEQLAAPLLEATRKKYELELAAKDSAVAAQEAELRAREEALTASERSLEKRVSERMTQEREAIAQEESVKAEQKVSSELNARSRALSDLRDILEDRNLKLAEAQKAQAEIVKKERELADAKREMELTIEKRVTVELEPLRAMAKTEAAEEFKLKVLEREQTISSMQRQIEELKKRAEQGSQQLQGEVQELELETLLKLRFPFDSVEAVAKGEHGGDIVHCVNTPVGLKCGAILWEAKRTKNWSDAWLVKLREDQRNAKAEIAILISQVLPKGIESFDLIDGVWVAHPRMIVPLALTLRQTLLEVATARQASEGQQSKATMVYQYLTGPRFRQRVQAIVEAFGSMQEDLDKEKRVIQKQWAKREEQIGRVMQSTVGMFGDLQGIAGKSLQEIEGLDMDSLALEAGSTVSAE